MQTATPRQTEDGRWYVFEGYDVRGQVIKTEVDAPAETTMEMSAVQTPVAPAIPPEPDPVGDFVDSIKPKVPTIIAMRKGLFYREPNHGQWYESLWFWFWIALTVVGVIYWESNVMWTNPTYHLAMISSPFDKPGPDPSMNTEFFMGWFLWLYVGWMPIGIGCIGALQKAGFVRLAAVLSVTMMAAMAVFFAKSKRPPAGA